MAINDKRRGVRRQTAAQVRMRFPCAVRTACACKREPDEEDQRKILPPIDQLVVRLVEV